MNRGRVQDPPTQVEVIDTVEGVEAIREIWRAADVRNVDSDIDYFLTVLRTSASAIRPHVVLIRRSGAPDVLGLARLEEYPLRLAVGHRVVGRPRMPAIVVTFGGLIGAHTRADVQLVLDELARPLRDGSAEALVIRRLDCAGMPYDVACRSAGLWRVRRRGFHRWTAPAPESLDAVLASRSTKTRQTILRQDRRLLRDYKVRLERFTDPRDAAVLVRDMESVASTSYQRALGVGYTADDVTTALTELGLRHGWLRAWMLYLDDRPVAFWTGVLYAGTFTVGTPAYDPAYARDSVGRYTLHRMVEDVCADDRVTRLDLGQGDADYKSTFRPTRTDEADLVILAHRARPACVGGVASVLVALNASVKWLMLRSAWGRRLMRSWQRGRAPGAGSVGARLERCDEP